LDEKFANYCAKNAIEKFEKAMEKNEIFDIIKKI